MIDLSKIKEDFSLLVKEAQPWTLTQFVMWLDLKLSEFKIKGYMVLDHNIKTKPKWLTDDVGSGEAAPSPAPCPQCHKPKRDERQYYSDIHASPSELQYRTVTKSGQSQQESEENIRGGVGIIDLSEGLVQGKRAAQVSPGMRSHPPQSYRQHPHHAEKDSSKHQQPEVIEIDAPAPPPQKQHFSPAKTFQKTSTPIGGARFPPKPRPKPRPMPPLMTGPVYVSTSSTTVPTFSTNYTSQSNRTVATSRSFALGAPPSVTTSAFSVSTSLADYQNLENLITQAIQSTETPSPQQHTQNISPQISSFTQSQGQPRRNSQQDTLSSVQPVIQDSQQSYSSSSSVQKSQPGFSGVSFDNIQHSHDPTQSPLSSSSADQNIFASNIPSSQAVPVALHANMEVINRENSSSSLPSVTVTPDHSDITEIKIESDPEDSVNDSIMTDNSMTSQASTSQSSISMTSLTSPLRPGFSAEASGLPKPGLVDPETAKAYHMVELVAGSGVYVYERNISQAFKVGTESQTGTYSGEKMARYLLNVFWSRKELVGSTLSKVGRGKKILNQQIIEAILGFCLNASPQPRVQVRRALVNSVTAATCHAKKRLLKKIATKSFAK